MSVILFRLICMFYADMVVVGAWYVVYTIRDAEVAQLARALA